MYYNQQKFNDNEFDQDKRIDQNAVLYASYSAFNGPSWTETWVEMNELEDEIDLLQLGYSNSIEYTSIAFGSVKISLFNNWPTKDAPEIYKFNSFWLELRQYKTKKERQTYSLLEWLGDVGGLNDGLNIFVRTLIGSITGFSL